MTPHNTQSSDFKKTGKRYADVIQRKTERERENERK